VMHSIARTIGCRSDRRAQYRGPEYSCLSAAGASDFLGVASVCWCAASASARLHRVVGRNATCAVGLNSFVSVDGALAGRQKCLPTDALRVFDPAFLALG